MLRKAVAPALLALVLNACTSDSKPGQPAASPTPAPPPPVAAAEVDYSSGFFAPERVPDGTTWRWMGPEGVVKLRNTHRDMTLTIKGRTPAELLSQSPTITLTLNGEPLDTVTATKNLVEKEYTILPSRQGTGDWSELRFRTNVSYVPHEVSQSSPDQRRLAFTLYSLAWAPK
jgi:hypothetical protein